MPKKTRARTSDDIRADLEARARAHLGLVHIDAPTWFDAETGDVTHALDRDGMTPEEIANLELTGFFDPKFLVRIPQDDGDGSMYNPEIVARVLEAAENILPERFTAEEYLELLRQRRSGTTDQ